MSRELVTGELAERERCARRAERSGRHRHRRPGPEGVRLRGRVGLALVGVGLHLLATSSPRLRES